MIKLEDFFRFFKDTPEQDKAIKLLEQAMPAELLSEDAPWVKVYRHQEPGPEWPLSKEQLGVIMQCQPRYLPDELMDDLAQCCQVFHIDTPTRLAYFLGQCGEESAGLRYPLEIASGEEYEWRRDLGNHGHGDGRRYKGAGFIQVTGRNNHQGFSDYMQQHGHYDPHIMQDGSSYSGNKYPWSISGYWWNSNGMNEYVDQMPDVDRVGARVNGVYPPRGAGERRAYTRRAMEQLGLA